MYAYSEADAAEKMEIESQKQEIRDIFGPSAEIDYNHVEKHYWVTVALSNTSIHQVVEGSPSLDIELESVRPRMSVFLKPRSTVPVSQTFKGAIVSEDDILGFEVSELFFEGEDLIKVFKPKGNVYVVSPNAQYSRSLTNAYVDGLETPYQLKTAYYDPEASAILVPALQEVGHVFGVGHESGHSNDPELESNPTGYFKAYALLKASHDSKTLTADNDEAFNAWLYIVKREVVANKNLLAAIESHTKTLSRGDWVNLFDDAYILELKKYLELYVGSYLTMVGEDFIQRLGATGIEDLLSY